MKLAIAGVLVALATPVHAECAFWGLVPKVATPSSTTLPVDGGIVVLAEPSAGGGLERGDPALVPNWRWKGLGKVVVRSLAPGLAVVQPPKAGSAELVDGKGASQLAIKTSSDKRRLLDAPSPIAITHAVRQSRRGGEDVVVELATAPAATAIAIVLLDDTGQPKSWQPIRSAATSLAAYSATSCIALPNGTRPTKAGDLVRVAFVDDAGRMSAASKAFKVQAKPSPNPP